LSRKLKNVTDQVDATGQMVQLGAMNAASFPTSFGHCAIAWNENGLTGFHLPGDKSVSTSGAFVPDWITSIIARVQRHFDGELQDFADLRFDFARVTSFQHTVYAAALKVKAGTTRTYGWLANEIGRGPSASRAVGTALGRNPWVLLVPCHRFLGANGKLTGFSAPGGIETKRRLLALERAELFVA
jgi:methylated-DNA-[protein]-cysteine S-methyltransferase